jgi:hypothetical protein
LLGFEVCVVVVKRGERRWDGGTNYVKGALDVGQRSCAGRLRSIVRVSYRKIIADNNEWKEVMIG